MKQCQLFRPSIVLFALGHVAKPGNEHVSRHLRGCGECQEYLQEVRKIKSEFASLASMTENYSPNHETTERLFACLIGEPKNQRLFWPTALAACLAMTAVSFLLVFQAQRSERNVPVVAARTEYSPLSISTYRFAAEESFDQLDKLLTQQALRSSTPRLNIGARSDL